ncbi:MAG: amidohydrolase [Rhizobiaceae bacterium]
MTYAARTLLLLTSVLLSGPAFAQGAPAEKINGLKDRVVEGIDSRAKLAQEMVDTHFSFGELGFQEIETSKYITGILEKNGFAVQRDVAGLPTGWTARWGSGSPVIALGSDIDGLPTTSQYPGVAYKRPMIEGAPGHGEGHNSGQAVNVVAALALKEVMEKENIQGTIMLWPGVAEELLAGKAYMVRDGVFKDVDAVLFTHVGNNMQVSWGQPNGTGMVSVEYTFEGESAHSAANPWRGRSALDGVELMNVGWNMRREHLRPVQRSHYTIPDGGDQPNVVPPHATVWYFIREMDFANISKNFEIANTISEAAAKMSDTSVTRKIVGTAAPRHFNKPMAEAAAANIEKVGLPQWSEDDQAFAKAVQKTVGSKQDGLASKARGLIAPVENPESGGSDDIGDISWVVPTITLNYPSNIPNLPGHHWSNAMAMATPIAHKGVVAGSKVIGMTALDLLLDPELVKASKAYFADVQNKDQKYLPVLSADDKPQIQKNVEIMARFRDQMKEFYYDPSKHETYLEQLGIKYPVLEKAP